MASKALPTFEVDKVGLGKLLERKGKEFAVTELVQNAWDEASRNVTVTLEVSGNGRASLRVEDDNPDGFTDLSHAYTLFAESEKKDDPTKRGRFNLGEKLVIALCDVARIETTSGTVVFNGDTREHGPATRDSGSVFTGEVRMTPAEVRAAEALVHQLLPPKHVTTTFNGIDIPYREPLKTFEVPLRTEKADEDGVLRPTQRKAEVAVYIPAAGEPAMLYEMGIPVVETGDTWHVNVAQKIPLNTDRDNVQPAYLRDLRAHVLNHSADLLDEDSAGANWVDNALESKHITPDATAAAVKGRYGDKVVTADPNDREAEKIAVQQGYAVLKGGAFSKAGWGAVKGAGVALPAGQVTPSPKPYDDGPDLKLMAVEHWPEGVQAVADYAAWLAQELLGAEIEVRVANAPQWPYAATYGPTRGGSRGILTLNYGRLGHRWFAVGEQGVDDLLIHEFGHHYESDHLSRKYLDALTSLGARMVALALRTPATFVRLGHPVGEGVTV